MTLGYSNWLSVNVWISEVIGSFVLALLLFLVLINYLCLKSGIGLKSTIVLNLLGALTCSALFYSTDLVVIIASVLPLLLYGVYAAFWSR